MYTTGEYLSNNPTWHAEDSVWKAERIHALLHEHGISGSSVVEIGCGAGEILVHLAQLRGAGCSYTGFDVSPQAFALASPKSSSQLKFVQGDFFASEGQYDVALVIDVLEHLEDYFSFLRKLKPRADYKVFHIPLDLSAQTVLRETPLLEGRTSVGHIHYFTKGIALRMLEETGHEILGWRFTQGAVELPRTHWKTRMARPLRRWMFRMAPELAARSLSGFSLLVLAR
jgi:SAM-dependent methyltransferase